MFHKTVSRLAPTYSKCLSLSSRRYSIIRSCATSAPISRINYSGIKVPNRALLLECGSTHLHDQQKRFKHKKRGAKEADDEDDDYDSDEEVEEPGSKIMTGHMASLRADLVIKTGLGIARNKVETLFYESKVRVNGAKILKKSQKVNIGDELDVIKGPSPANENMTIVSRVTVLNAREHEDGDKLVVKMRRYKSLTIESEDSDGT